eukprot:4557631-Amphidinium_carterae.1
MGGEYVLCQHQQTYASTACQSQTWDLFGARPDGQETIIRLLAALGRGGFALRCAECCVCAFSFPKNYAKGWRFKLFSLKTNACTPIPIPSNF